MPTSLEQARFDRAAYRERNLVEWLISRLKQNRAIATHDPKQLVEVIDNSSGASRSFAGAAMEARGAGHGQKSIFAVVLPLEENAGIEVKE